MERCGESFSGKLEDALLDWRIFYALIEVTN
jgi:hypothetical protein